MTKMVLDILSSSYKPILAELVSDILKTKGLNTSVVHVNDLLTLMEKTKLVARDDDSWYVPIKNKIVRTITHSAGALDKGAIIKMSFIAGEDKDAVDSVLAVLRKEGVACLLRDGKWISQKNLKQWMEHTAYVEARKFAVETLRKRCGGLDKDMFISRLSYHMRSTVPGKNWRENMEWAIRKLITDRIIDLHDGMFRLATDNTSTSSHYS